MIDFSARHRHSYHCRLKRIPDKLFWCHLQKLYRLDTSYCYRITCCCLPAVTCLFLLYLQLSLRSKRLAWLNLMNINCLSSFCRWQHCIWVYCNCNTSTSVSPSATPHLKETKIHLWVNKRSYAYIGFYTGCWSPSLTAGWSGHLSWHRLCAQIRNETSLCRCSLKTSYTETGWKKVSQRLKAKYKTVKLSI